MESKRVLEEGTAETVPARPAASSFGAPKLQSIAAAIHDLLRSPTCAKFQYAAELFL